MAKKVRAVPTAANTKPLSIAARLLAFTGIAFTLGYVLTFIGYDAGGDEMTPQTLTRLRLFIAFFPSACIIGAMIAFSRYRLSRERVREIQEALRARRKGRSP